MFGELGSFSVDARPFFFFESKDLRPVIIEVTTLH